MRKNTLVPLFAVAIAMLSGQSLAWTHVSGSITSIDPKARQIVLDNGTTYTLQRGVKLTDLAAGDKVTVNTEERGGQHVVNKVTKTS